MSLYSPNFTHHPFIRAVILCPNQAVAGDFELIGACKVDKAIGGSEVPTVLGRMDCLGLHAVFGRENLEVPQDQSCILGVPQYEVADPDAEFEAATDSLFQ